jgi:Domain of unknown function (DUF1772)
VSQVVTGLRWHQAQALAFDADGVAGSSTALDVTSDAIEVTHQSSDAPVLAGSVVYLVGAIGLTIAYHVPRNEALAAAEPQRSDAARQWARYLTEWTKWNHVRAAAALAAAAGSPLHSILTEYPTASRRAERQPAPVSNSGRRAGQSVARRTSTLRLLRDGRPRSTDDQTLQTRGSRSTKRS